MRNTLLEVEDDDDQFVRRGSLLTTREKELAESRAELLKMFGEMVKIKTQAAHSRREARELREHIIVTSTKTSGISFGTAAATFTVVLMLAAVGKLTYNGLTSPSPIAPRATRDAFVTPNPSPVQHRKDKADSSGELKFNRAIGRLQDALDALPGDESETVREINEKHPGGPPVCPLGWTNGAAALSLRIQTGGGAPPSLTTALNQCADAAEKLVAEHEAALEAQENSGH